MLGLGLVLVACMQGTGRCEECVVLHLTSDACACVAGSVVNGVAGVYLTVLQVCECVACVAFNK